MTEFLDWVGRPSGWLSGEAPRGDIVLSSRIRLARNLAGREFPQRASQGAQSALLQEILDKTHHLDRMEDGLRASLVELDLLERRFLAERQLVSPDLVEEPESRGVVVSRDESESFMINEEDHLRIQAIRSGLDLDQAYRAADALDTDLDGRLDFAFSERFGFLTACPTNTGTGMRASVLIHLPGVVLAKEVEKLLESLRKKHLTIRGFYGEGSAALGNFFQISNSVTLGVRESEVLEMLDQSARDLVAWEEKARKGLLRRARSLLSDKIWRSYGVLRYARSLTSQEALNHVSLLRLGVGLEILKLPVRVLNEIMLQSQPAHAQILSGQEKATERDAWRATMVREKLQQVEP